MCRLLGVAVPQPEPLNEALAAELPPFTDLSAVHCDGWGLAYWDERDDLVVRKAAVAARTSTGYAAAVAQARTDAAVLHLRRASAGMQITPANTHPFVAGSVAFAHNGFFDPAAVSDLLGSEVQLQGQTDSERYFALVLQNMREHDPVSSLQLAMSAIESRTVAESLNVLMLTHSSLFASCRFDERQVTARGLPEDAYRLRFRAAPDRVVVASSGWDQPAPEWEPLDNGVILQVRRTDLQVTLHRSN